MVAGEGNSMVEAHRKRQGFMAVLTSAACEWFLIFLLLIDAVLSYLLTKFANYCKLQTPCILCSRLDRVIGNERPKFYHDLFCSNHISEISSLISCHIHNKLADGHRMCDDCIFSLTTKNISLSEMHRIWGGKLGIDIDGSSLQSLLLNGYFLPCSVGTNPCSCCGKPWRPGQNVQRLYQLKSSGSVIPKRNVPFPRLPSHGRLHRRNIFKKMRNKSYHSVTSRSLGKSGFDPLSDVGYTELKINSDSESEVPFSDDDDATSSSRENCESKNGFAVQSDSENPSKVPSDDFISARATKCPYARPLISDMSVQPDVSKAHDVKSMDLTGATAERKDEINWHEAHQKPYPCRQPELILLDEVPASSNVLCISREESIEKKLQFPVPQEFNPIGQFDLFTLDNCLSLVGASSAKGTSDIRYASIYNHGEILKSLSRPSATCVKSSQVSENLGSAKLKHIDASDWCESDGSEREREREASSLIAEPPVTRESDRLNEEPILLSSFSEDISNQGFDLSSENTRQAERDHGDVQITSGSDEIQILRKSASVESSLESLDPGNISEIEGENIIDRLRRQVEYDRKCIKSLYKEVGEERSAAAVAANEAMAMITRLQEEKSALHMEALQYLRMMEEQAEYDVDALEKANDLLAEREKEMQDMEAELEFYRLNFPDEKVVEDLHEGNSELNGKSKKVEGAIVTCQYNTSLPLNLMITEVSEYAEISDNKIPHLGFEDEKLYISQCLQSLETKLHEISCSGAFSNIANCGHSKNLADDSLKREEPLKNEETLTNSQTEECDSSMKEDLCECNGSTASEEDATASDGDDCTLNKANAHCDSDGQKISPGQREVSLVALENEISDLNDRLEALEADHGFLEHMLNSLQNGSDGLQFIQEVAYQLQELRKIGIRLRNQSVP
ncbi:Zein-binding domain containing protein [Parasponia andersonii]|uniref:Zein-binding domain containing protein n=1 Tax=Parasponia andersonii TaxID=3476 RepID=A0A2P5AN45_PARAD|nr:Zein-binding domain containing protein [Parasponia andersonii]